VLREDGGLKGTCDYGGFVRGGHVFCDTVEISWWLECDVLDLPRKVREHSNRACHRAWMLLSYILVRVRRANGARLLTLLSLGHDLGGLRYASIFLIHVISEARTSLV
jgi:hypothetical protein